VRILIAEDNPVLRGIVLGMLEKAGHVVTSRQCGLRTLRTLQERQFDMLMLDLDLPGLRGEEILDRLPALNADIRVLIISGGERPKNLTRAFEFLKKPFCTADLLMKAGVVANHTASNIRVQLAR
jgi:CheY-like chemotaxis protein